jgi:hypothetical protein
MIRNNKVTSYAMGETWLAGRRYGCDQPWRLNFGITVRVIQLLIERKDNSEVGIFMGMA